MEKTYKAYLTFVLTEGLTSWYIIMFQYILQYLIVMKHQEIYYEGHVFSLQPKKLSRQSFVKLQNCDIQEITFVLAV